MTVKKTNNKILPFLRWAGGKRWLASQLAPAIKLILNQSKGTYFEPFLGAGAMFFSIAPQKSELTDLNDHLIETFNVISKDWKKVLDTIMAWTVNKVNYYKIRDLEPSNSIERAARFIYLNRTCYGGIYRENKKGLFNVPYGGGSRTTEILKKNKLLERAHKVLKNNVEITCCDFERKIDEAQAGDVVYCDPTYSNVTRYHFDRYGSKIFSWEDQLRLAKVSLNAMKRRVLVLISNGAFDEISDLYPDAYKIRVKKTKTIGMKAKKPDKHEEYLLILDPFFRREIWSKIGSLVNQKNNQEPLK